MSARIPFPANPTTGQYYTEPDSDIRWQYNSFKKRWSLAPLPSLSQAFISSLTTPGADSRHLIWIDPSDGTQSYWDAAADAWVVTSGSGSNGEDGEAGEDLTTVAGIVTIATAAHTLVTENIDQYNRFTYAGGDARTVTVPEIGVTFAAVTGSIVTLRNTSATTNVTIEAGIDVSISFATGADTLGPRATAQLLCVDADTEQWDIL